MDLISRIRATDASRLTSNDDIYAEYKAGHLTRADFKFAIDEYNNARTPQGQLLDKDRVQFAKTFDRLIDGMMNDRGEHSLLGSQKLYEFDQAARRQEEVLRQQGKDPHLVYDARPDNPYYFGRPENITKYRVTMKDALEYEKKIKFQDAFADQERQKAAATKPGPAPAAPSTEPRPTTNLTGPNTITLPRVNSKADYDKLDAGAEFTDNNGNRWTKPGKK
jgi:hypothetical protein